MRVWRYDATRDAAPEVALPGDLEKRRAVLVAAPDENSTPVVAEAPTLGFASLLAHWRAGWATAEPVLDDLGFEAAAPGIWRRGLST